MSKNKMNRFAKWMVSAALAASLTIGCVDLGCLGLGMIGVQEAKADDLLNTVPSDENYRDTVYTYFNGTTAKYGPGFGPYSSSDTGGMVRQSTSRTSATTFAAGLPLGTIFIDQDEIGLNKVPRGGIEWLVDDYDVRTGLKYNPGNGLVSYDTTIPGSRQLSPGVLNEFSGPLFSLTFTDAAILPDGSRADVKVTYSNAKIVVDQRISMTTDKVFVGEIRLAQGSSFAYGVKSTTRFAPTHQSVVSN